MSDNQTPAAPGKKVAAKLILLAPRLRGVRTVGRTGPLRLDEGGRAVSLEERVAALSAEINRRWRGAD